MRRGQIFWGVVLVVVGLALLLGLVFDFNVWSILGPLALILVGLYILWSVLVGPPAEEVEVLALPLEGAQAAKVTLEYGAGRLFVAGGVSPGELLSGEFGGGVRAHTERHADRLAVRLRPGADVWVWPWSWWSPRSRDWRVALSPEIPLELRLETGALDARLDLSDLLVTDLRLSTGASSSDVILPAAAGFTRVKIEAGAASVVLRVPEGVAALIKTEVGLASVDVDRSRFPRVQGAYRSPDYDVAEHRVEIRVEGGLGSISVR